MTIKNLEKISEILFTPPYFNTYFDIRVFLGSIPVQKKYTNPSILKKEGFRKTDIMDYQKTFSGLLTLTIRRVKGWEFYGWSLNEENFQKMIDELNAIRKYIDITTKKIYLNMKSTMKEKDLDVVEIVQAIYCEKLKIQRMRKDFLERYEDFFTLNQMGVKPPYCRFGNFFFDACKTTKQSKLYSDFIDLFLNVFGTLEKTKSYSREIPPLRIKVAILMYCVYLLGIKAIKKLYKKEESSEYNDVLKFFDKFKSPEKAEEFVEKEKVGEYALEKASSFCNTTPKNFKQILKEEKEYFHYVREQVINEPEELYSLKKGTIPLDFLMRRLKRESPKENIHVLIRCVLTSDAILLSSPKR